MCIDLISEREREREREGGVVMLSEKILMNYTQEL